MFTGGWPGQVRLTDVTGGSPPKTLQVRVTFFPVYSGIPSELLMIVGLDEGGSVRK